MPAAAPTASRTDSVQLDLFCLTCDYNLRMQPVDGRCPECGQPISATLNFPRLARAAPRWLTSLRDSTTLLIVGWALFGAFAATWPHPVVQAIGLTVPWALCWMAAWMLTRSEPRGSAAHRRLADHLWGWALRIVASGTILVFCGPDYIFWGSMCSIATTLLYFLILRRRAQRLPSRQLALLAIIVGIFATVGMTVSLMQSYGKFPWPMRFYYADRIMIQHPLPILGCPACLIHFVELLAGGLNITGSYPLSMLFAGIWSTAVAALLLTFRITFVRTARLRREATNS
jgi:hypothetical protein